jgi:hypothetical protein
MEFLFVFLFPHFTVYFWNKSQRNPIEAYINYVTLLLKILHWLLLFYSEEKPRKNINNPHNLTHRTNGIENIFLFWIIREGLFHKVIFEFKTEESKRKTQGQHLQRYRGRILFEIYRKTSMPVWMKGRKWRDEVSGVREPDDTEFCRIL